VSELAFLFIFMVQISVIVVQSFLSANIRVATNIHEVRCRLLESNCKSFYYRSFVTKSSRRTITSEGVWCRIRQGFPQAKSNPLVPDFLHFFTNRLEYIDMQ